MIRLRQLTLHDVRNVCHGTIHFDDLPSGGSITGIYGQNGSGKTAVIDSIMLLRNLISGDPLPEDTKDVINATTGQAKITALIETDDPTLPWCEYSVTLQRRETTGEAKIVGEKLRANKTRNQLGRGIITHETTLTPKVRFEGTPEYMWKSTRATPLGGTLQRSEEMAYVQNRSLLFAHAADVEGWDNTVRLLDMLTDNAPHTSERARTYIDSRISPLARLMPRLSEWAANHILVSTTRRSGYASYQLMPITEEHEHGRNVEHIIDLIRPNVITPAQAEWLQSSVATFDQILPNIIPGLHIQVKITPMPSGDHGEDRVSAELMSARNGETIPFRCESEGVIRITMLLGYLVHVYNDPDTLVAVDEFDSGIYEFLLGDLVHQLVEGLRGQLVFTAHNLHSMEVLPDDCIKSTTTNPRRRFTRFVRRSKTTNIRDRYLKAADIGWSGPDVYDAPLPRMFSNSLYRAGHPVTADEDRELDKQLERLAGRA